MHLTNDIILNREITSNNCFYSLKESLCLLQSLLVRVLWQAFVRPN